MAKLQFKLDRQLLTLTNQDIIASGDSNFDSCIFTFDTSWDGFVKTAVFYQDKSNVQYMVLENDDTCMIPTAAMARAGRMYIGVFGIKDTAVLTSSMTFIDIVEGAISGDTVSTEPTDDVFLAIIAQYQRIAGLMVDHNQKAEKLQTDCNALMQEVQNAVADQTEKLQNAITEQNEKLQELGAFDVTELEYRMSDMEIKLNGYGEIIETEINTMNEILIDIRNSAFLIKDVEIVFDEENQCILEDERITEESVVNVYFDAISVESVLNQAIYVESFDGYIRFSTTMKLEGVLNCTIEVRSIPVIQK
ncbi:MAG: hypothetical protein NC489_44730 [Ruminococcus flavefaciens]|nr:hypothetical protein [Ruminococcus flavefaciens]